MRERTVMVTGRRPGGLPKQDGFFNPLIWDSPLRHKIRQAFSHQITEWYGAGRRYFINGGAIGSDQDFLHECLGARDIAGYDLSVVTALPFEGYEKTWPLPAQHRARAMYLRSDFLYHVCEPGYTAWKLFARNQWMLDRSEVVIALWEGREEGGTWNVVKAAREAKKTLVVINPEEL